LSRATVYANSLGLTDGQAAMRVKNIVKGER